VPASSTHGSRSGNGAAARLGPLDRKLLSIYLSDHLAGAMGGLELVRRAAKSNAETEFGPFLARLVAEVEEDRSTLIEVMQRLGLSRDRVKEALGWTAEKLGRLKLNGRITGYSPLSRLVELEALLMGVSAKRAMWRALALLAAGEDGPAGVDFIALADRATRQLEELESHRLRAAAIALTDANRSDPEL
jgi:hypothetical protein